MLRLAKQSKQLNGLDVANSGEDITETQKAALTLIRTNSEEEYSPVRLSTAVKRENFESPSLSKKSETKKRRISEIQNENDDAKNLRNELYRQQILNLKLQNFEVYRYLRI